MPSMSMSLNIAGTAKISSQNYCVDEAFDDNKTEDEGEGELVKLIRSISRRVSSLLKGLSGNFGIKKNLRRRIIISLTL